MRFVLETTPMRNAKESRTLRNVSCWFVNMVDVLSVLIGAILPEIVKVNLNVTSVREIITYPCARQNHPNPQGEVVVSPQEVL